MMETIHNCCTRRYTALGNVHKKLYLDSFTCHVHLNWCALYYANYGWA